LSFGDSERAIETQALVNDRVLFQTLKPELKEYVEFIPIYREEYWGRGRGIPISKTLTKAFNEGDSKTSVVMLLKWLYKVRCNLIHGEKDYDDKRQRKLLTHSSSLLAEILSHLTERYKQAYVNGDKADLFSE
jgi:hypothetical protein